MSTYLKQIEQLVALQKVDDEIHTVRQDLALAPKEAESLRERFAALEEQRTKQLDKITHLQDQEKRLRTELEDDSLRLKKGKSKLMQVGNAKEYHAAVREMDGIERLNHGREEEQAALAEELLRQKTALEDIEAQHTTLGNGLAVCETGLQARMEKSQAVLDVLTKQRKEVAKDVPMPIFTRYEFIRERLDHPVIVPVSAGICSGCHIGIPPQKFIELQKGTQILACPNCQRLMFWEDHFTPPAPKDV